MPPPDSMQRLASDWAAAMTRLMAHASQVFIATTSADVSAHLTASIEACATVTACADRFHDRLPVAPGTSTHVEIAFPALSGLAPDEIEAGCADAWLDAVRAMTMAQVYASTGDVLTAERNSHTAAISRVMRAITEAGHSRLADLAREH